MGRSRTIDRIAFAVMALLVTAFCVTTIPGVREHRFHVVLDGWLQGSAYVACGVVAVLGAVRRSGERRSWALLGAAIALRALGFALFLGYVRTLAPQPYPSIADAAWLAMSLALILALALRLRAEAPRLSVLVALDALATALLVAGVATSFAFEVLQDLSPEGTPTRVIATNLAYPLADVAMLVLVASLLTVVDWRPRLGEIVLFLGVAGFALLDVVFLFEVSAGAYRPGTWLASLSLVATAAMSVAPFLAPAMDARRRDVRPGILGAVVVSLACVGFLVFASLRPVPVVSFLLVASGVVVLIARAVTTLLGDRVEADVRLQATNDEMLRFQALVSRSSDFIAIAGIDGKLTYLNPAGRDLVGLAPDIDVTSTTIADYLTKDGMRSALEIEQPAIMTTGRWEGESTLKDMRGGPPIPVVLSSFLMFHPETGEPFAIGTVQRDISERVGAQHVLEDLAQQRQRLFSRLVQAQEDERARIAADVHDDSVQALAAVDLRLGLLRRRLAEQGSDLVEGVDKTLATVNEATARLRHLLFDLESPARHDKLADALTQAAEFVFEDSGIAWQLTGDREVDLPRAARVTAYRTAKEAMVNVRRHAHASLVDIGLARGEDGVLVSVADDGVGVASQNLRHRPGHRGLASVTDQAAAAGGWLRVEAAPGAGTRVLLWLPDAGPDEPEDDDPSES